MKRLGCLLLITLLLAACGSKPDRAVQTQVSLQADMRPILLLTEPTPLDAGRLFAALNGMALPMALDVHMEAKHREGTGVEVKDMAFRLEDRGREWTLVDENGAALASLEKAGKEQPDFIRVAADRMCALVNAERDRLAKADP